MAIRMSSFHTRFESLAAVLAVRVGGGPGVRRIVADRMSQSGTPTNNFMIAMRFVVPFRFHINGIRQNVRVDVPDVGKLAHIGGDEQLKELPLVSS